MNNKEIITMLNHLAASMMVQMPDYDGGLYYDYVIEAGVRIAEQEDEINRLKSHDYSYLRQ